MKLPWNRRTDAAVLSPETADQMLANVFRACEVEPNTISLQTLTGYSSYRRERFGIHRGLIGIIMAVFLLLPILFVPPSVSVTQSGEENGMPAFRVSVGTALPVRRVSAMMDGRNVPVYDLGSRQYSIQPTDNGEMIVTVILINGQITEETVTVAHVDTEEPVVTGTSSDDTYVYLTVEDADSGVRFDSIYLTDESGTTSEPYDIDQESGLITLLYPQTRTDVYISDYAGNLLHLSLKPQS